MVYKYHFKLHPCFDASIHYNIIDKTAQVINLLIISSIREVILMTVSLLTLISSGDSLYSSEKDLKKIKIIKTILFKSLHI
jgi:hypothetical protein